MIENPRINKWSITNRGYGSDVNPYALIVTVDECDTLIRLYSHEPTKDDIIRDYSMWKGGIQFIASVLFTASFKDNNLTDA